MKIIFSLLLVTIFLASCFISNSSITASAAGYATPDLLNGTDNLFLSYTFSSTPASGHRTKEQYKPLVGYYDTNNKLKDIFFDSFLFLPCVTTTPNGNYTYREKDDEKPSNFSDWQLFIEDVFLDGYNIKALDAAVGEIKSGLGSSFSNFKANVFLTVMYPVKTQTNFGDVDGDGITENFSKLADRQKAIRWMIDEQIARYEECDFENLNLVGFYWFEESYDFDDIYELDVITTMTSYVHTKSLKAIWIPYYGAMGYSSWKTYGFDVANYQPNYMFNETATSSRITTACNTAKKYGMGVEIESSGQIFTSVKYYNRYMNYLKYCTAAGANQGVKMYYNDAVPGVYNAAFLSKDPYIRRIYDLTYKYASKTLTENDIVFLEEGNIFKDYTIVSLDKSYTITTPYTNTSSGYGEVSGKELTDGIFGASDFCTEWVGFHNSSTTNGFYFIDVDLGSLYRNLSVFSIEVNEILGASISYPKSVEYFVSEDGKNYTSIGTGEFIIPTLSLMQVTKELSTPVDARYVRAKIAPGSANFVFVSEFSVGVLKDAATSLALKANTTLTLNKSTGFCKGMKEKMTASQLKSMFAQNVTITDISGNVVSNTAVVGTGYVISYYQNNKIVDTYTICLIGDINGDSSVSAMDYLLVKRAFYNTYRLNDVKYEAADINGDGEISAVDYLCIKRHFFGTFDIYK